MIGAEIAPGLNAIIAALPSPATATPDLLVDEVYNYISSLYYPSASRQTEMQIKSIAYHVINSVRNSLVLSGNAGYNLNQAPFVEMLIGSEMTSNLPAISFSDRLSDIEDNVGTSELTVNEQIPLYLATSVGQAAYAKLLSEIGKGGASGWSVYFSTTPGENYINTLYWGMEAMNGSLAGYGATPQGLISPTTDVVSVDMISALIGALTAVAGKVMFKWIPRITKPLQSNIVSNSFNLQSLSSFNGSGLDGVEINGTYIPFNGRKRRRDGDGPSKSEEVGTVSEKCCDIRKDGVTTVVACL
jgi:hypothetical protein